MNLRTFFTSQTWWGKIIGAFLGYLALRSVGAVIGIFVGNLFDRGLASHFSNPHWHFHAEKRSIIQKIFFECTFSIMGYIAKADGRVSEQELDIAKTIMHEMNLNSEQLRTAQLRFNEGKSPQFDLYAVLSPLQNVLHHNPELLRLFIEIQYRAAQVDGFSSEKQKLFNAILRYLGFAPLYQQHRFFEDFMAHAFKNEQQTSAHYQAQRQTHYYGMLDHAYGILEIPKTATKQEVKRAYRRLMSRNHPDKLIAKGLPAEMIKLANEKTQKIREAYEQICTAKGWS